MIEVRRSRAQTLGYFLEVNFAKKKFEPERENKKTNFKQEISRKRKKLIRLYHLLTKVLRWKIKLLLAEVSFFN